MVPTGDEASRMPSTPERFVAYRWRDPVVESLGFPVQHLYTETILLPVLGPSATWCLRRLGAWATACPDGVEVDSAQLASDLGLGAQLAKNSKITRTLDRLSKFDMVSWNSGDLAVRTHVAPVPERQLVRLSPALQRLHQSMVEEAERSRALPASSSPGSPSASTSARHGTSVDLGVSV